MASPTLYAAKLASADQAISQLEPGTPSIALDGVTYTAADLSAVYAIRDWLAVKAALEAIETGAQGYAIGGRSVSRADYEQLLTRERELDFEHTTPLSAEAVAALRAWQRESGALGDVPVFPAPRVPVVPMSRSFARDIWEQLEAAAGPSPEKGRGWHSLRRAFADELRGQPLKDLTALGGWKDPMTVVRVYQSATLETQRQALDQRRRDRAAGER